MKINEVFNGIDTLSDLYRQEEKISGKSSQNKDAEIIEKIAYETIVKYGLTNDLFLKGFDFGRYKSDNDYIWYDELIKILKDLEGLNKEERDKVISPELSFFFGYLRFRLKYADFTYNPQ